MNDDVEVMNGDWLDEMVAFLLQPEVGIVGAKLYFGDRRIQHAGLVLGVGGIAAHSFRFFDHLYFGHFGHAILPRTCSAVTAACLVTRRQVWEEIGGFDEELAVSFNDVDYCLRAAAIGLRTVYEPAAELIHHESPSRGTAGGVGDIVEFLDRWKEYISEGDRYLNPHLTRADPSCGLARPGEEDDWNRWYATVTTQ